MTGPMWFGVVILYMIVGYLVAFVTAYIEGKSGSTRTLINTPAFMWGIAMLWPAFVVVALMVGPAFVMAKMADKALGSEPEVIKRNKHSSW